MTIADAGRSYGAHKIIMNVHGKDFNELISRELNYPGCDNFHGTQLVLKARDADVSGGKIRVGELDKLKDYPDIKSVTVFGLTQETFEYFVKTYGAQFRYINFFKNKSVEDWSLLGTLPELEYVYWFHNQKITKLWDMSKNLSLKAVELDDFTKLHDISGIEKAPSLEWFGIGNTMWRTLEIDSLKPLADTAVKRINFWGKCIRDMDISFLPDMKQLEVFDFPFNHFTTEQVAWIVAKCPKLEGYSLRPYVEYKMYNEQTRQQDIPAAIIVGKRMPTIPFEGNEKKIEKYI